MPTNKITACTIGPMPTSMFDPMPEVNITLEDGTHKMLFTYYPDEISFIEQEFIGLTEDEARKLKYEKDLKYLRS